MLRFILYFVLVFVLYRLIRSIIQYVVKDRSSSGVKNPNPPQKSKYENIEEAKFTEIKEKDEKKSEK